MMELKAHELSGYLVSSNVLLQDSTTASASRRASLAHPNLPKLGFFRTLRRALQRNCAFWSLCAAIAAGCIGCVSAQPHALQLVASENRQWFLRKEGVRALHGDPVARPPETVR